MNETNTMNATNALNSVFADQLGALETIMSKRGEPFRAKAYKKAQETVASWPSNITTVAQLKGAPNIGTTVMEKLNEYVNTGKIQLIEEEKNNPVNVLTDVYGIGPKKAAELVTVHGIQSIAQLRSRTDLLNDVQRVGLKYYEDILLRIPRAEIELYRGAFSGASVASNATCEIVGSYRRGASESGDIDVIITSACASSASSTGKDKGASEHPFELFVNHLIERNVIIEVLSRGACKCLVIAKIGQESSARRVDFLFSPKEEYPFALLYFTGSKLFNTMMRQSALDLGFTMNEHGFSLLQHGVKTPVHSSSFKTEKCVFDFLNMEYVSPDKRNTVGKSNTFVSVPLISAPLSALPMKNTTKKRSSVTKESTKKLVISDELVINATLMIDDFRKQGIQSFAKYGENCLKNLLNEVNDAYHNNEPLLSDNEFDVMEQYVLSKYGNKTGVDGKTGVGAPVVGGKTELPYEMASMDKIKPDTMVLDAWKRSFKGPYVISCKLDGVSGLYCTEQGKVRLYTRGDGKFGQDISYLIPYLNLPPKMGICIRGEFIIAKNTFAEKYATTFANPRNMVAGLINHKHNDSAFYEKLRDVRFVAYEVITPALRPSEQFYFLKQLSNIDICYYKPVPPSLLSNELLSQLLVEMRGQYIFETDGIIVSDDHAHERPVGNPEYAFAFKMALSDQMAHAKVVDVLWSVSKDGYLKPRVQFEPIFLGGVKIEYATGFNAAFILQNKIGVGAVVKIIRSGDVIPHIMQVVVQARTPLLPTDCEWVWNDTNVDIVVSNLCDNESVIEKTVTLFFKEIGVDGLGPGTVKKICKAGFNSIVKVVKMTKEEMAGVGGLGEKSANKICDSIAECMGKASLTTLMSASNLFGRGFGERKISPIMELFPTILLLNESKEEKVAKVLQVKGVASKSAIAFVEGIDAFNDFFSEIKGASLSSAVSGEGISSGGISEDSLVLGSSLEVKGHFLFKKTVVLTGFRDKDLLQRLKDVGAIQGTSVSKNTFAVVVKQAGETGAKIDSALKIGVPVFFLDDFNKKYFS